ncbi:MAG: peptidyl-prolyl cis-trans isomerase [Epsilonproteobacteria bacterium]|nr:peptidyl-prolyl cis-trans isomerase [Campylobacterota bacterium]
MTEKTFTIAYIIQPIITKEFSKEELQTYYNDNKTHFRGDDGKILPFEQVQEKVKEELNKKETKKEALRKYIALKKGNIKTEKTATVSISKNEFNQEIYNKVAGLTMQKPFAKPIAYKNGYIIIQLTAITPSRAKTFEEAKEEVTQLFIQEQKTKKLQEVAQKSFTNFEGTVSDFVTLKDADKLTNLPSLDAKKFLAKLFKSNKKQGYIVLNSQNIVLYNILEQKLLNKSHVESEQIITGIKQNLFNANLLKVLQNKYKTEIYYKGL